MNENENEARKDEALYKDGELVNEGALENAEVKTEAENTEIPEEYEAKIVAITMENEGLKGENETLNRIIAELRDKLSSVETELLKKNDFIRDQTNQIKELRCVCDNKTKQIEAYRKELKAKSAFENMVMGCCIQIESCDDCVDAGVSLEEVLTVAKDAGCVLVNFAFSPDSDEE